MSNSSPHVDKDLDLSNAGRGVWLVKVRVLDVMNVIQVICIHFIDQVEDSSNVLAFILDFLV
jgi:hypothetical protein